ncbi:MAG TPA: ABC transporter permease, partial [Vicinamibacterales bacterium]|nr:ABC transporter permease [Vicinamibacterales bacterium]
QHLDDRYQELLAGGATTDDALRATLAEFDRRDLFAAGMAPLRQVRHADLATPGNTRSLVAGFVLDLRQALRGLRKDWGVTTAAVLTLAIGIGANTAIFSVVHAILLRPLPFADASRLVNVWLLRAGRPNWHFRVPPADFEVIQRSNHVFAGMAFYENEAMTLTGGGDPEEVSAGVISADVLNVLGVRPAFGRPLGVNDEETGAGSVVLVSDGLWRRRFAAHPSVIGTSIGLNDRSYRVIGVMPPRFSFPGGADVWLPRSRTARANAFILARLRADATIDRAQADMDLMVAAIASGRPNPGLKFNVEGLKDTVVGNAGTSWFLLLGAVACVLAIGCANVSNLMMARGLRRQREIDIRLALGASRMQIVRLLVAEGFLLSLMGCVLALVFAAWSVDALRAWAPIDTPRLEEIRVAPMLLWIAMALSAITTLAVGLTPALQLSRTAVNATLSSAGTAAATTRSQSRARDLLVVIEIALALVLLVGASLLVRSLVRLSNVNPGFDTARLLTANLHLTSGKYTEPAQRLDFIAQTLDRIRSIPGVASASASSGSVMKGWGLLGSQHTLAQRISVDQASSAAPSEADMRRVEPAYFTTMGVRVVHGRPFSESDREGRHAVAIVNETMAKTYWGGDAAIDKRLAFERTAAGAPAWLEVVGIVNDTRDVTLTTAPHPQFYIPLQQNSKGLQLDSLTFYVRSAGNPLGLADAVRAGIWSVDPKQPIAEIATMEIAVERFLSAPRFRTMLLAMLAAVGLLLALLGIYAVIAYSVNQRTSEMAIRLALGANRREVTNLILKHAMVLTVTGTAVGVAGAVFVGRLLSSLLYELAPVDPPTLVAVSVLLVLVALIACYPAARRAARTDLTAVLRGDAG